MTTVDTRAELIAGLRELANFLEQHPDAPIPPQPTMSWAYLGDNDAAGVAYVRGVAAALGVEPWIGSSKSTEALRRFGPIQYGASYASRAAMLAYRTSSTAPDPAGGVS